MKDPKPSAEPPRFSSCTGPALENRILTEASSFLLQPRSSLTSSCPALLPSSLSSTSSSCPLLSTSSDLLRPSSALTGTENTLLKRKPLLVPSLCSPYPLSPLIRITAPPSDGCLTAEPKDVKLEEMDSCSSEELQSSGGESEEGSDDEEQPEMDVDPPAEMPVLDLGLTEDGEKQKLDLSEEFRPVDTGSDDHAEILKETKYQFLNMVCCSLVQKNLQPGQLGWNCSNSLWYHLEKMGAWITPSDPEFLLKVAVYTRQELNIRITANFLLALAAHLPDSKPHLRRYFCAAVQLPSDWLEVTRIYSTCFSKSLPSCLKKALTDKFQQFSEYQLAKYNTRKHRCKHNKKKKRKEVSDKRWEEWACLIKTDVPSLQRYLQTQQRSAVDKQQSEFNMKKFIKRLHIKQPAEFVMSILGKRYPADARAFWRSGLSGVWESERANQRMRLKQPETWETRLSQEGNTAATWEKLIDNNALPFMAMLRNLRNMITQGISAKHHDKILKRLCSKSAVIQSRQFPFRFLSAYKVIMELKKFGKNNNTAIIGMAVGGPVKPSVSSKEILRGILKKMPKSRKYHNSDWTQASRKKLRSTLSVPFVRRVYDMKRKYQEKASQRRYSAELLQRYAQALEEAVQISCRYNVPPLSGSTLIIFLDHWRIHEEWTGADFCLPPDPTTDPANTSLTASPKEAALLLAMMIGHCCEHPQFLLADQEGVQELRLQSDSLLENVRSAMEKLSEFSESTQKTHPSNFFSKLLEDKAKVDNIIMIDEYSVDLVLSAEVERFRKESICQPLCVNILIRGYNFANERQKSDTVTLYGFSEQMIRFISERGSSRFLDHVEGMDKLHNIPPPAGAPAKPERTADVLPLPAVPKLRWQGVRVFISSTFRDMHAERDVLLRSVFPELRRRAATLCLHLQEVDLRWGVTEEQSARATEICLSEVCRSQLLLGILGERYGVVPPRPSLPELPQYGWLSSAPDGLSVTEMEIRQFQAVFPDSAQSRMFFYFRSPQLVSSVPEEWRSDFVAESEEAAAKMSDLKTQIRSDGFKVTENYPCEWGGVVDGRAYLRGLEDFAKAVLDDLWSALQSIFTEESDEADLTSEIKEQEAHQDAQCRHFYGRAKLISLAKEKVQECQKNGGVLLVDGAAGLGKTAFMAALAHSLQTPDKMRTAPVCDVISYSTAPSQSACAVETLLRCLVQWLKRRGEQEEAPPSDTPYRALLSEWHCQLRELKRGRPLALLVDGADLVRDPRGQAVSEWIPERLPKGVCLVLSVASDSSLRAALSKKKNCVALPVGVLPLPDRREIVQKELSTYGKKLSDSAFNNQLQTLLMKKGAASPLYLRLACEELRNYASFEKMKENLQNLPVTLSDLVQFGLTRLQDQYGGAGLDWALAALTVSTTGVREQDLYALLNLCTDLSSTHAPLAWHKVLHLARNPKTRVPMATFSRLARSLRSLMGSALSREPDDPLILKHPDVRSAFERLYCPTMEKRRRAHVILAAHLWVRSDPLGRGTFLHCDASALLQLPDHLMKGAQWPTVDDLLSSFYFLYANVHHGFLPRLLEYYVHFCESSELKDRRAFLKRHAPLLSHWPALFVQQALNEPRDSAAHVWAQNAVEEGNAAVVRWINNTEKPPEESGELVSTFLWTPSCVALSPAGLYVAVGTERGSLHLFHSQTNQEVKSLVSSCDGISGCVFLDEGVVWTTSYDGQVEVWDVHSGCRTAHLNAHSNRITGCDVSSDRKHFATVSLDFNLKVWASQRGTQVVSLQNPAPLNCVAFDPEGSVLAVGCWDGTVRLWDWIRQETLTTLSGHQCSVRSVTFSSSSSSSCASSSSLLCSGGLDGEVRLWSVAASTCVWRSRAHRGSTETLRFLCDGETLLSAGHDGMVQLWSGGLGCSVAVLGEEKKLLKTSASKHVAVPEGAALCVAVNGHHAAVGYHGDGVKVYNLQSGERVWTTEDLRVSVSCVLWLQDEGSMFLLSGGFDQRLRLWRKQEGTEENLELRGAFGIQKGAVLALDQNSTYVASGSDDFTIALWLKRDLTSDPWVEPRAANVLRGHQGGVTCLSFSPGGDQLLSGGKDQALMVWDMNSSPPVLSHSLPYCHGDWITGCAWSLSAVLSCSNDCRLRLWDIATGSCIREVPTTSSLSTLCCWDDYVMLGSADGLLTVWKSDLGVIAEIRAHGSRLHHTAVISKPGLNRNTDELLISTASEDGTVKIWQPLQVEHRSTLLGHSAGVQALTSGGGPQFLTVSEDRSLRAWTLNTVMPPRQMECVSVLCFLQDDVLVCGYSTGRLEIWRHSSRLYSDKVSESCVRAVTGLPDDQVAVGCGDCTVSVWKLLRDSRRSITGMSEVMVYTLANNVKFLHYYTTLLGVCVDSMIIDVFSTVKEERQEIDELKYRLRVLAVKRSAENGLCILGEEVQEIKTARLMVLDPNAPLSSGFKYDQVEDAELSLRSEDDEEKEEEENQMERIDTISPRAEDEEEKQTERIYSITAAATHDELTVCGDSIGNMWFNQPPDLKAWSPRRPAHSDRISALHLTTNTIVSASYDRTVKLWDRTTKKQVGLFVCAAPVEVLQVNPNDSSQVVCGDALGQIYFLSWTG